MTKWKGCFITAGASVVLACTIANAAEIRVLSSVGMRSVLEQLQPGFERSTGHKLSIAFGSAAPLKRQIDDGAAFDVAVLTASQLADLATSGKVAAGSAATIARTGLGLAARKDAPSADIRSPNKLKRVLLAAKSVAYSREGQSGIAAAAVLEKLGIAEQMKSRIDIETRPGGSVTAVVEGKAELGFGLLSEIVPEPAVKLLGAMPGDFQSYVTFAAGASANAGDAAAARALVEYMRSAAVQSTLAARGMEGPGK
jgi:molybdate transport system substrate-binding protein